MKHHHNSGLRSIRTLGLISATILVSLAYSIPCSAGAASAKLGFTNNSSEDLKTYVGKGGSTDIKSLSSGDGVSYEFGFGNCNKTKERTFKVVKPLSGGASWVIVEGDITIEADRENGSCKATLTFNECDDSEANDFTAACDNKTQRIGRVTIEDK